MGRCCRFTLYFVSFRYNPTKLTKRRWNVFIWAPSSKNLFLRRSEKTSDGIWLYFSCNSFVFLFFLFCVFVFINTLKHFQIMSLTAGNVTKQCNLQSFLLSKFFFYLSLKKIQYKIIETLYLWEIAFLLFWRKMPSCFPYFKENLGGRGLFSTRNFFSQPFRHFSNFWNRSDKESCNNHIGHSVHIVKAHLSSYSS